LIVGDKAWNESLRRAALFENFLKNYSKGIRDIDAIEPAFEKFCRAVEEKQAMEANRILSGAQDALDKAHRFEGDSEFDLDAVMDDIRVMRKYWDKQGVAGDRRVAHDDEGNLKVGDRYIFAAQRDKAKRDVEDYLSGRKPGLDKFAFREDEGLKEEIKRLAEDERPSNQTVPNRFGIGWKKKSIRSKKATDSQ